MSKVIREVHSKDKINNTLLGEFMDFKFFSRNSKIVLEIVEIAKRLESMNETTQKTDYLQKLKTKVESSSISEIIELMKCKYEIVRIFAARSFIDSRPKNIIKMIECMLGDKSENLRLSCIEAINYMSSVETLYLLEKSIQDKSIKVRLKTVTGLADIAMNTRDTKAISLLNQALFDANQKVREYAIDELGLIGNQDSFCNLLKLSQKSSSKEKDLIRESLDLLISKATAGQTST